MGQSHFLPLSESEEENIPGMIPIVLEHASSIVWRV